MERVGKANQYDLVLLCKRVEIRWACDKWRAAAAVRWLWPQCGVSSRTDSGISCMYEE